MYAWQLRSIALVEAAVLNQEPAYPTWPADLDPEMEGEPDQLNALLEGYPLAFVLLATYDHHQEHLEKLLARLPK